MAAAMLGARAADRSMQTLAVISRKGGAGKTTLSVNLAVAAFEAGVRTMLADVDSQRSTMAWAKVRTRPGPAVVETSAGKLFPLWSAAAVARCELMILDTPSGGEAETLQALRLADACLLICRPNFFDVTALSKSVEQLRQFDKPGLIVLNQAPPRRLGQEAEPVQRAIAALAATGLPLARIGLRHRAVFPAAAARGLSVRELDAQSAGAREVDGVWTQLRELLWPHRTSATSAGVLAAGRAAQSSAQLPA